MTTKTLCEHLSEFVSDLNFDRIPTEVIAKTKSVILHDIAVAFGGVFAEQSIAAVRFIDNRNGEATVIGQPFKASPTDAAVANTVMIRALRMEDSIVPSFVHPGAFLIPTAFALAEKYRRSGREIIAGLVAAYDVIGRLSGTLWSWEHCNRASAHVFGAFGVAALAARLMGLDDKRTAGAIAHAANLGAMVTFGFEDFQYGIVARNGILAANLASCGAPYPRDAIEGPYGFYKVQMNGARPDDQEIVSMDRPFDIMTTILKPHPCTAINLVPIQLARQLMCSNNLTADDVLSISVTRSENAGPIPGIHEKGPFSSAHDVLYRATSSLPFALGVIFVDGEIMPDRFRRPVEPEINAFAQRVTIQPMKDLDLLDHSIEIKTKTGECLKSSGGAEALPWPDSEGILKTYAARIVGVEKIARLQEQLAGLEKIEDIKSITTCFS